MLIILMNKPEPPAQKRRGAHRLLALKARFQRFSEVCGGFSRFFEVFRGFQRFSEVWFFEVFRGLARFPEVCGGFQRFSEVSGGCRVGAVFGRGTIFVKPPKTSKNF